MNPDTKIRAIKKSVQIRDSDNVDFKQTEVGLIPEDWEMVQLRDCAVFGSGTTPSREFQDRYYKNGSIPWVKTLDLNNATIHEVDEKVTSYALKEVSSLKTHPVDSVLVAMYGGFNQIGRTGILAMKACVNQAITVIRSDKKRLNSKYLIHLLNYSVNYWKDVASSSRKDPNITSNDVKDFPLRLPPLAEQTAIATALSDMDALIEAQEQLIAKKRAIKQGAMQELLQPKEGWVEYRLGEFGKCLRGVSYNGESDLFKHDTDSTVRLLRSNNIQNATLDLSELQFVNKQRVKPEQILQDDDIFICMANGSKALVGKTALFSQEDSHPYTFGAFMGCFRIFSENICKSLIFDFFQTNMYREFIDILLSGSSINNLKPSDIESIDIKLPEDLKEQTRIANILSDMDTEIEQLESQLAKYRQVKVGMMQELLTGRKRLNH